LHAIVLQTQRGYAANWIELFDISENEYRPKIRKGDIKLQVFFVFFVAKKKVP
jgi:hypothetical protein